MYAEVFQGLDQDADEPLATTFEIDHQELVLVRDIRFHSMCEHHLLPFMGVAHVGYIPPGRERSQAEQAGPPRARVCEATAGPGAHHQSGRRCLMEQIDAAGAIVVVEAEHMCMSMRGVRAEGAHRHLGGAGGHAPRELEHPRRGDEPHQQGGVSSMGQRRPQGLPEHLDRDDTLVMGGVLNVTPDSFSDGGQHDRAPEAIAHGRLLVSQGADIVDVGGESTRPGAPPCRRGRGDATSDPPWSKRSPPRTSSSVWTP